MIGRKMVIKVMLIKNRGNKKDVIVSVRKGDCCYTVTESLADMSPTGLRKAEFVSNELASFAIISQ